MYPKKKQKKGKLFVLFILALLLIAIALFFVYKPYLFDKYGIAQEDKAVTFEITNDNKNDVPYCLYQEGVIESVNLFKNYMSQEYGSNFTYANGTYHLNANMSYKVLGVKLQAPDIEALKVTIPEGKNAYQISKIMEESGACKADDFLDALGDEYDFDFLTGIDNADARPYLLEGYLFAGTYDITADTSAHEIVQMMLSATALRLNDDFMNQCNARGVSADDVITMASIIEKESSAYPTEMSKVSGVFWNRVNRPQEQNTPTLGSDPTVAYADMLEEQGYAQKIWKGYSTYSAVGLPTGPICSPGETAIKAALEPEEHDYFYFFTDKEEHFYYFEAYEQFMKARQEMGV